MDAASFLEKDPLGAVAHQKSKLERTVRLYLDRSIPFIVYRWSATGALFFLFALRILLAQGWYIVAYTLGIYLLSGLIAFLTPKIDPSLDMDSSLEDGNPEVLPTRQDDEFRPFIRRLPEFKFWLTATRAIVASIFATFFQIFDVPVFWPILVFYFITLFGLTMHKQIRHMIKYRYLPFDFKKKRFGVSKK